MKKATFNQAFPILCIAYFLDILFYSLALASKTNMDTQDKLAALHKLSEFQQIMINTEHERQDIASIEKKNERRLIAREMHNELSNSIIGLKYYVNDLRASQDSREKQAVFMNIEAEIEEVYLQARDYMHKLNKASDDHQYDLSGFLRNIEARFTSSSLPITIQADYEQIEFGLSGIQKNTVYFILKEALTNTMKHARASEVNISLEAVGEVFLGIIADNGVGIDNSKGLTYGIGMQSMHENIASLNGSLHMGNGRTNGSVLTFSFPLGQ